MSSRNVHFLFDCARVMYLFLYVQVVSHVRHTFVEIIFISYTLALFLTHLTSFLILDGKI
jgi:hypothetical protein